MQCNILKRMVSRACEFSGKGDFAQNCVFKVKGGTLEIRACNGESGISISTVLGVDMKDMVCAINIYALESILKTFDSDSDIEIKIKKDRLTFISDDDKGHLPVMDEDTVFYVPKPQNWIAAPEDFAEKLITIRGMHFKTIKGMDKDNEDLIIIRGQDICQLSRSVYVFEVTDTKINISVEAKLLQKISPDIEAYCVENNRLYFKNADEWCMITASSKTIPKYEVLFTEVQKLNNSVISINSDSFLAFCEKLIALKKAEEYSLLQANHSVRLEFKEGILYGMTAVGGTQIKIDNTELNFNCNVVADFFKAASHRQFLKEDEVLLHVGSGMRLLMAVNGTTKIMGVLCRA